MSLQLKQIRLTNWKCYQSQNITFNFQSDRNISIVFGQNGFGKTSLMEAILWCLYGGDVIEPKVIKKYFHRQDENKEPAREMRVELNFVQESRNYFITRTAKLESRGKELIPIVEEALYNEDGQEKNNPRDYIDALLPRSIRDFFCFDGVKIEQYARMTQTTEAKQAIEKVLGIPELRNLRTDTESALKELDKQLNKASSYRPDLHRKTNELKDLNHDIEIQKAQLRQEKEDEIKTITIHQDSQERARQIEDLKHQLDYLEELKRKRSDLQHQLEGAQKNVTNWLKKAPASLLLNFVQEIVDDLQRTTIKSTINMVSSSHLKEIIQNEICICGRCLDNESRDYLLQQIEELQPVEEVANEIIAKDRLKVSLQGILQNSQPNFDKLLLQRDSLEDDLDELKRQIEHLQQDTAGTNREEAAEIWKKVGITEQKVQSIQEKISRLTREIDRQEKQAESLRNEVAKLASQNKITETLSKQVILARGLRDAANELIEWHIDRSREVITQSTSDRYCQVTNKPDEYTGVEITQEYTLGIRTVTGQLLQPDVLSAGEKEALAFAFITGLNQASQIATPLIMDTPFGHLDALHQRKIIESLPNLHSQVIVLATDRDFPEELLTLIRPHVAEIMTIHRLHPAEDGSTIDREG